MPNSWEAEPQKDGAQLRDSAHGLSKNTGSGLFVEHFFFFLKKKKSGHLLTLRLRNTRKRSEEARAGAALPTLDFTSAVHLPGPSLPPRSTSLLCSAGRGCLGCRGRSAQTLLRESTLIKQTGAAVLCSAGWLPKCLQEDLILFPLMEAPLCCSHLSSSSLRTGTGVSASLLSLCTWPLIIGGLLGW